MPKILDRLHLTIRQKVIVGFACSIVAFMLISVVAYRNLTNYDKAFQHYATALKMNPEHRGAHEYVGETYLAVGNLAKAKEHLAALDRICFFGCVRP